MQVLRRLVRLLRSRKDFCTNHEAYELQSLLGSSLLKMAQTDDKNTSFGMYKSACCGQEIAITFGATFPHCPRHRRSHTEWIAIGEPEEPIRFVVFPQKVMISDSDT
jgi:hypothetical protein